MWLAPLFLLGLLGVGLPLWLHRFARRTDERRPFASLMLIEAGEVRRSRRQQLRYWLLLALRLALPPRPAMPGATQGVRSSTQLGRGSSPSPRAEPLPAPPPPPLYFAQQL